MAMRVRMIGAIRTPAGVITCISLLLVGAAGRSPGQQVEVLSEGHAKGIVVLRASFPSRGELHSFGLEISLDGETFVNAKAGPTRGLRFAWPMTRSAGASEVTVLVVPVAGRFGLGHEDFLFAEPGSYDLRWDIAFKDREAGDLKIEQTVVVRPATRTDLEFLARIGDGRFWRDILGKEPPEAGTKDLLALGVISLLLENAEADPGEEGHVRGKPEWADAFMSLAREFPESSYAPYAAFTAGRIYHGLWGQAFHGREVTADAEKHEYYKKANEALRFAVDHGDPFLKPRALCSRAFLRFCTKAWDDGEDLLNQAKDAAKGQGAIYRVVDSLRLDIQRAKDRHQRQRKMPTEE